MVGAPAHAQTPLRGRLSVTEATSSCVSSEELADRVDEILGRDAIGDEGELTVEVDARLRDGGVSVLVTVSDATGARSQREVRHAGACGPLVGTLSVIVAMLLDDRARAGTLEVTRALAQPASAPPAAMDAPPVAPTAAEPSDLSLAVAVGVVLPFGLLPGVAPGLGVRGELGQRAGWHGELGLTIEPWSVASGAPGGEFSAFAGAAGVCTPRFTDAAPLALAGCVTATVGAIRGTATGVAETYDRVEPLVMVGAALETSMWIAPPLAVALRLGVDVPLLRPSFFVQVGADDVVVHEPWWVVPFVGLDIVLADAR